MRSLLKDFFGFFRANVLLVYNDDSILICDLFHNMLTYKLIQCDRTCQWVINIINMEKTFAPNNSAKKQNIFMDFFFKRMLFKNLI